MYPNRSFDVGEAVAVQPDGKILVAGLSGQTAVVARFESDGTLDRSFGREGIARAPGPVKANAFGTLALRVLSDGTVVVVRVAQQAVYADHRIPGGIFITRLRSDGTRVSTSNFSAPERTRGKNRWYGSWVSASVLTNGSVITAGQSEVPNAVGCNPCLSHAQLIVRRFRPDGSPDATFGRGGRTLTRVGTTMYAASAAVSSDGSFAVVGTTQTGNTEASAAVRFSVDGTLDDTFGRSGVVTLPAGTERLVAIEPDGGLLLVGAVQGDSLETRVVKLDRTGQVVPSFGQQGQATRSGLAGLAGLFAEPDGAPRLILRHETSLVLDGFTAGGQPDATLGGHDVPVGLPSAEARALATTGTGKVFAAGSIDIGGGRTGMYIAATQLRAFDDRKFGTGGEATVEIGDRATATAVVVGQGGRAIAAGLSQTGAERRWIVVRLRPNGALDPTFGAAGVSTPFAASSNAAVAAAAAIKDGRLLLLGRTAGSPILARLSPTGMLDTTFGVAGSAFLPLDEATALAVDGSGAAVVAGTAGHKLAIVRVDAKGRAGVAEIMAFDARAAGVALQRDGLVVLVGTTADGLAVVRIGPAGDLDMEFGDHGVVSRQGSDAAGLVIQRDGKIALAVRPRSGTGPTVLRLLHSGRPDPSFGDGGGASTSAGMTVAAIGLIPDGIVVAGAAPSPRGTDFAVSELFQGSLTAPVAADVYRVTRRGAVRLVIPAATQPAVAPDGRLIAFIGDRNGGPEVFVSGLGGRSPRQLTRTPLRSGAVAARAAPSWSRDGSLLAIQMIGEEGDQQIYVVAPDGSGLRKIADGTGASWGDGRRLSYVANEKVWVIDLDAGTASQVADGRSARWSPRENLIAVDGTQIIRPDGHIVANLPLDDASWAPDGKRLVGFELRNGRLVAYDLEGRLLRTYAAAGPDARSPVWSPDGRSIAYVGKGERYRLVILDARTGKRVGLWAQDGSFDFAVPSWGPSGVFVAAS